MHFKLRIIKYSALSSNLILQLYIKQPNYTNFSKKNKLINFCGHITEKYFNILAHQFFCFYSRFFGTNINKAQMTKRSSRVFLSEGAKMSMRSSHLSIQMTRCTILCNSVVLKLFASAAHFGTFPNFAAHLDQSADLFWSAPSFPRFPLPDALY